MEEKRLDAEAQRQEAQRQHEIRLLSIMSQQTSSILKVNLRSISHWLCVITTRLPYGRLVSCYMVIFFVVQLLNCFLSFHFFFL